MKILVAGALGQLGRSLGKIAREYPAHCFTFTDMQELDIADPAAVSDYVAANRPALLINCAAYTNVDKAETEPQEAYRANVDGPRVLAEAAAEYGFRLVHISTDYVYDGSCGEPLREDAPTKPSGVYGETKLMGEREIERSGAGALILRTSWLYSEFGHNFVKTMLALAERGDIIRVVDDQRGCPTYAGGLARAIMSVADVPFRGFQVYNYCDAGDTTWFGFASEIFRMCRKDVNLIPVSTAEYGALAERPAYSVLDTSAIRAAGAEIRDWRENLAECLAQLNCI